MAMVSLIPPLAHWRGHLLEAVPAPKSLGSGRSASARPRKAGGERTPVAHPPQRQNNELQTGVHDGEKRLQFSLGVRSVSAST